MPSTPSPRVFACGCANPRAPADSLRVLEPAAAGTPRQDPIRGTPPVACCPPATPRSPARLVRRIGPHRPAPRAPGRQPRNTLRQPSRVQRLGARSRSTAATSPALGRAPLLGCGSQATWPPARPTGTRALLATLFGVALLATTASGSQVPARQARVSVLLCSRSWPVVPWDPGPSARGAH